ncbi:MAG TPA: hypothetical protein PKA10_06725 [Selenomonadales bacterium]|nr:hypothetical protein [Selenomonadales bacterium]
MKHFPGAKLISAVALLLLAGWLLAGCTNTTPTDRPPYSLPPGSSTSPKDIVVTYNYHDTDKVQLSDNNISLSVGQKLILRPAPGLTKNTRFTSSGQYFFGEVMKQDNPQETGKATFTAIKPGKGRLQIIPSTDQVDRATDLWVTVK